LGAVRNTPRPDRLAADRRILQGITQSSRDSADKEGAGIVSEDNAERTLSSANKALGNERVLRKQLEMKYSLARQELDKIERSIRNLHHDNALLKARIAELESRG
jgi:hypothetical protein